MVSIPEIPQVNYPNVNLFLILKKNLTIFNSLQLNDFSIALGTIGKGVIFLDSNLNFLAKYDKSNGLNNNTILSLFQDQESNIWLGLDNGISVININSPFQFFMMKMEI